jgi:hypothetical protein
MSQGKNRIGRKPQRVLQKEKAKRLDSVRVEPPTQAPNFLTQAFLERALEIYHVPPEAGRAVDNESVLTFAYNTQVMPQGHVNLIGPRSAGFFQFRVILFSEHYRDKLIGRGKGSS